MKDSVNQPIFPDNLDTYDVPRTIKNTDVVSTDLPADLVPADYDVPKNRDSLSTIEEEHQEYDVPKAVVEPDLIIPPPPMPPSSDDKENLYQNQGEIFSNEDDQSIYANDDVIKSNANAIVNTTKLGGGSTHSCSSDDRSSGYRSSSSPSIQSEELYVNELALTASNSMEDSLSVCSSGKHSASSPELLRNFAEDTGKTKKFHQIAFVGENNKFDGEDLVTDKEKLRERERQRSEEIEREIFKKKEEKTKSNQKKVEFPTMTRFKKPKSAESVKPPETYFDDKKKKPSSKSKKAPPAPSSLRGESKEQKDRDRSVDVYNETVRQRATSRPHEDIMSKDVFNKKPQEKLNENANETPEKSGKKFRRNIHSKHHIRGAVAQDIDDDELPSVRQLRSRFEDKKGTVSASTPQLNIDNKNQVKKTLPKFAFKKGFNVMSSLTRRSAISVSKSLHNININYEEKVAVKPEPPVAEPEELVYANLQEVKEAPAVKPSVNELSSRFEQKTWNSSSENKKKKPTRKNSETLINGGGTFTKHRGKTAERNQDDDDEHCFQIKGNSSGPKFNQLLHESQDEQPITQPTTELTAARHKLKQVAKTEWNPTKLVTKMYKMMELSESENDATFEIEGYLERLPPGKKKSTIWNSWKRQYFVVKAGILMCYTDQSCGVLMERIELNGGGRVDFMESTMLGVQDRRGHYVVIKCKDPEEAKTWERVLAANVSQESTDLFVLPRSPTVFKNVLVVDFGGASVRAGIASVVPTLPQLFFPAVMAVAHDNEDEKYFGLDAFAPEVRHRCQLRHPMIPSRTVNKFSIDPIALQGILEKIFKELGLDHPGDYAVQLSAPRPFGDRAKATIASILFEEFGVKAVNMAHQSIFAMYAYDSPANTGVVVDLGERMDVVPIVDGFKVSAGVSRSAVGGFEMRSKLQHYLQGRNYALTSFIDGYVSRYAIEKLSYMSRNFDRELDRCHRNPDKVIKQLDMEGCPSVQGGVLEMGTERFEACEGLFKPELWGLDQAGIHVLVHKAIRECGMDVRKTMTQHIFLAGGLTLIPGFKERLEVEMERLNPAVKPRVHASPYRYHAAYLGACVQAATEAFNETKISRNEFSNARSKMSQLWSL